MKATGRNVKQAAKVLRRFEQFMRLWADRSRRGDGFSKKNTRREKETQAIRKGCSNGKVACMRE
jgi:hypothetical protein